MATALKTIFGDAGKPDQAVPVTNECALPGVFTPGELTGSPIPIPTTDGAAYLALEIIWAEIWPATHNRDVWGTGPDGTYAWRNQADGAFD
ncbi:MAG: hypothetical protein ACLPWF_30035 [Bryobacteraceae bacterium]